MVEHEFGDASPTPVRVGEQIWNVSFIVRDVWHHESKSYYEVAIKDYTSEIGIVQTFGDWKEIKNQTSNQE